MLPSVPEWKFKKIVLTGHITKEPMLFFYRNALDCVEYLFGNPVFANKMDFCPVQLYRDMERTIRVYTEWMTGNAAWDMQVGFFLSQPPTRGLTFSLGNAPRWCNAPWGYPLLGQDQHLRDDW